MAAVAVRNLSEKTHRALKARAKLHGVSTEAEIRSILDEAVEVKQEQKGFGTLLHELAMQYGGWDLEIVRSKELPRAIYDDFD